jgi:predicted dehydrogenase
MTWKPSRRRWLHTAALAGVGAYAWQRPDKVVAARSPHEKLNVAVVGVGGRGAANRNAVARTENIVALCDVDSHRLAQAAEQHPQARQYADFRRMLEQRDIDAVVVSTPDHTHAAISLAAMELGKHVYCEKPLASSIADARLMAETAARTGVVTQMGNQLHASEHVRTVVELLRAETLGPVHKVITFCHKVLRHAGEEMPSDRPAVPEHLDWNLWLGPAEERPYHPAYHPAGWRAFWGLGSGNFGDMACHILDAPYWGLNLHSPISVEAEGPPSHPHVAPKRMRVRYQFPRAGKEPLEVLWYDGELSPPESPVEDLDLPNEGALVLGERGYLLHHFRSGRIDVHVSGRDPDFPLPEPSLGVPASHYWEWIEACKGRGRTHSDFSYGAALTETILAGIVAYRVGQRLEWNGPEMRAENCPEADLLIRPRTRAGWPGSA